MEQHTKQRMLPIYVRNLIFGVEDGLVSTVGFLAGVAAGGVDRSYLVLSGTVLIVVEAFSMGAGSFLSESSSDGNKDRNQPHISQSVKGGLIMFVSYVLAGFWVLAPYFFTGGATGIFFSIFLSIIALFFLGWASATLTGTRRVRRIIRMITVGGFAVLIGVTVGILVG